MKIKLAFLWGFLFLSLSVFPANAKNIVDSTGNTVSVPDQVSRIICSGPGALRLITYFNAQELVVAVDDMETARKQFDARPYAIANPGYKKLPVFGEFRGNVILKNSGACNTAPGYFKTYATMGMTPLNCQENGYPGGGAGIR